MTVGVERTRCGRLWATWIGGGDNEKAFLVAATSDDDGTILHAGWNLLEVKVASGQSGFAFACQIDDRKDLRFAAELSPS